LLREYELFYIVRPDLDEEQVRVAMDEIANLVAGHGGEVTKSSLWGRRRLAYTIAGFTDGYYVLKEMALPGEKLRDLERQLKLDERVIRQLITLRQVYLLPEGEDRRGRVRHKARGQAQVAEDDLEVTMGPADEDLPDDIEDEAEDVPEAVAVTAESGEEE
jgi:small subunit ribosomal protein S6